MDKKCAFEGRQKGGDHERLSNSSVCIFGLGKDQECKDVMDKDNTTSCFQINVNSGANRLSLAIWVTTIMIIFAFI